MALAHAQSAAKRGWFIFPCRPDKRPYIKGWPDLATTDEAQIAAWSKQFPGCRWGVATGPSGLFVVDVDVKRGARGLESLAALEAEHGPLPATLRVHTISKGWHTYFQGQGRTTASILGPGLDTRSAGGYVIAPDGQDYTIEDDVPLAEAPVWLLALAGSSREKAPDAAQVLHEASDGDVAEAAAWLATEAPKAVVGNRDNVSFQVAAKLRSRYGLDEETAQRLMVGVWLQLCPDAGDWSAEDIAAKVASAYGGNARLAQGGEHPATFFEAVPGTTPAGFTAAELLGMDIPETRWAVDGLLPEGLTILAGRPKLGKSWAALQLCIAVAEGGEFLGHECEQGETVYLALEDGKKRLQDRLKRMLQGKRPPKGMRLFNAWRHLDQGGLEDLDALLSENPGIKLLIVDTWQKLRPLAKPRGASAYEVDYAEAGKLKALADEHNVCLLIVHHLRKSDPSSKDGDVMEKVNGSSGITGAADSILILDRSRNTLDAELHATGRDIEEGVHALTRDKATMGWNRVGDADGYARTPEQQTVLNAIRELKEATPKQIADFTGLDPTYVKKASGKLLRQALVIRKGYGKYAPIFADETDRADQWRVVPL